MNDGFEYSLPSEAEWEYACRAGTTTVFSSENSFSSAQANFDGNFPYNSMHEKNLQKTVPVGSYYPNAWGLYDMHGNVGEWCEDIYQDSYDGLPCDGSANTSKGSSNSRVLRGGAWYNKSMSLRSADRSSFEPTFQSMGNGFRVRASSVRN